jgi:hypothetical protein
LSGVLYYYFGLIGCLWACVGFTVATALISRFLPTTGQHQVSLSGLGGDE